MEITKHLVVDDLLSIGGEVYVVNHLVMRNEIVGVDCLAYVVEGLHIYTNMEFFVGVDSLVTIEDEDFLMKHYI